MKLFIDVSPGFYKTNLFNALSRQTEIYVIYTTDYDDSSRNKDFLCGEKKFPYKILSGCKLRQWLSIIIVIARMKPDEVIVGGYTSISDWISVLYSPKKRNAAIIESTYRETKMGGYQFYLKKVFFRRISKAYVCGTPHEKLTKALGFRGKTVICHSVGLINRVPNPHYIKRSVVNRFLFVGRLISVKNLPWLIGIFEKHQNLELNIIGFGDEQKHLESLIRTTNIHLIGAVDNKKLSNYYQNSDVFVLPSLTETWGLVVEEALNNGLPVMCSNMVGCADDLVIKKQAGVVFDVNNIVDFEAKLQEICSVETNNRVRLNISMIDFEERENLIINSFTN